MENNRCVVIVPAHNEEESLGSVLQEVIARLGPRLAALVVGDDGSNDRTFDIARHHTDHVVQTGEPGRPAGNGKVQEALLKYTLELSRDLDFKWVIRIDSDWQHNAALIGELPPLMAGFEESDEGCDVVVFSRFRRESDTSEAPENRLLINLLAALLVSQATGLSVTDARSGYFCYSWELLRQVIADLKVKGYGGPTELLLRVFAKARDLGFRLRHSELPHPARYGADLPAKVQAKWTEESPAEQAWRMENFCHVFRDLCQELNLGLEAQGQMSQPLADGLEELALVVEAENTLAAMHDLELPIEFEPLVDEPSGFALENANLGA